MKLSDVTTKLTCVKSKAVRVLAAVTLAGAALAVAPAAQAQHFGVAIQFGGPRYVAPAPVYYGPNFYEQRRFEERQAWLRQQEFERRERFEREHRFNDRNRFDRDHDRFDHR